MPQTSRSSRKSPSGRDGAHAPAKPLPDRDAMDDYVRRIPAERRAAALLGAQQEIYDAWEKSTTRARVSRARKALAITPLCADAFNLLAEEATTPEETLDLYALGVLAGERALGPEGFEDYAERFWGYLETRPYMRARAGLGSALLARGDGEAALAHFRAMLALNPRDNQGIRYIVLAYLLQRDDMTGVKALLSDYAGEYSTAWLCTNALVAYRDGKAKAKATRALLKDAWSCNEHVPPILAGTQPLQKSTDGTITLGAADDASDYVASCADAWRRTPGAIEWLLATRPGAASDKRRPGKPAP